MEPSARQNVTILFAAVISVQLVLTLGASATAPSSLNPSLFAGHTRRSLGPARGAVLALRGGAEEGGDGARESTSPRVSSGGPGRQRRSDRHRRSSSRRDGDHDGHRMEGSATRSADSDGRPKRDEVQREGGKKTGKEGRRGEQYRSAVDGHRAGRESVRKEEPKVLPSPMQWPHARFCFDEGNEKGDQEARNPSGSSHRPWQPQPPSDEFRDPDATAASTAGKRLPTAQPSVTAGVFSTGGAALRSEGAHTSPRDRSWKQTSFRTTFSGMHPSRAADLNRPTGISADKAPWIERDRTGLRTDRRDGLGGRRNTGRDARKKPRDPLRSKAEGGNESERWSPGAPRRELSSHVRNDEVRRGSERPNVAGRRHEMRSREGRAGRDEHLRHRERRNWNQGGSWSDRGRPDGTKWTRQRSGYNNNEELLRASGGDEGTKEDSDDWMYWSDDFDRCVDNGTLAREMARDHDEEALAQKCSSTLHRERREIFVHRWREISGQENFVKGRYCRDAETWLQRWAGRVQDYIPTSAEGLRKYREDALALLGGVGNGTDKCNIPHGLSSETVHQTSSLDVEKSEAGGDGHEGFLSAPKTSLEERTKAYLQDDSCFVSPRPSVAASMDHVQGDHVGNTPVDCEDGGKESVGDVSDPESKGELIQRIERARQTWREGPKWGNLEIDLVAELDEMSLLGSDRGVKVLDTFLVERPSEYLDRSFGGLVSASLSGRGTDGHAGCGEAEMCGIPLHYDSTALPTVLDVGSEIPPGVVRFLGTTMNGGWRNPAKHTKRTGVSVLAAGKYWDETYANGTTMRVRGSPIAAFDLVNAHVDEYWATLEDDNWPAPAGTRYCQPGIGVTLEDVLEWSPQPVADYLAVHEGWFTLDIGRGRRLLPTSYCIRNGGSRFGCPYSWLLYGAESRLGPWFALDARGFDWVNMTDNYEPLYKELAEGQKYVFPNDHELGGRDEPQDGFLEPIPHHAAVWRVRNPDESGRGFRFFRLMQIRGRMYEARRMVVQGFELYGDLLMGLEESELESLVNPPGLTQEEEELLEDQNEVGAKKSLSWDPRVLMERERQRDYKGPTYADKMSEAYRDIQERFEKLTTDAINAGKATTDAIKAKRAEGHASDGRDSDDHDADAEPLLQDSKLEPSLAVPAPDQPRIELFNLQMMDSDEMLRFVWGQEHVAYAILDVKRWAALGENRNSLPEVLDRWVHLTSAAGISEVKRTCQLLGLLVEHGVIDGGMLAATVANEGLSSVLRAENMTFLKHLNSLLTSLKMTTVPIADQSEDDAGVGEAEADGKFFPLTLSRPLHLSHCCCLFPLPMLP